MWCKDEETAEKIKKPEKPNKTWRMYAFIIFVEHDKATPRLESKSKNDFILKIQSDFYLWEEAVHFEHFDWITSFST